MSQIAFVTWNGGGNLGPALAIARELRRRGHRAAFLGQETQRPAIEAAGHAYRLHARSAAGRARQPRRRNASAC